VLLLTLVTRIYALCKTVTGGGASGSVAGIGGSVNPFGMVLLFQAMRLRGRNFVDLGAGDGRVLVAAVACGARRAWGCELPVNTGCIGVFLALLNITAERMPGILAAELPGTVMENTPRQVSSRFLPELSGQDIERVGNCKFSLVLALWFLSFIPFWQMSQLQDSTECVFSFWVGHPIATQDHTLALCASCPTVDTLVVFKPPRGIYARPLAGSYIDLSDLFPCALSQLVISQF
jgi:hypothetical protein